MFIETPQISIREFVKEDVPHYHQLYSDTELMKYVGPTRSWQENLQNLEQILKNYQEYPGYGIWAITTTKQQDKPIGVVALKHGEKIELGYRISQKHQRKGLMTESVLQILNYGFQSLNLEEVVAFTHPQNRASKRLLEKVGFQFKVNVYLEKHQTNLDYYSLTQVPLLTQPNETSYSNESY